MSAEPTKPEKQFTESKEFRTVYANTFAVRASDNDVALTMAAEVVDMKSGNIFYQTEVRVMMTPRSAKVLSLTLYHILGEYEKTLGPISLPPGKEDEITKLLSTKPKK